MTDLPGELTSDKENRQESMIQQIIMIKVIASIREISRRRHFFIIEGFICLYNIDPNQHKRFKK